MRRWTIGGQVGVIKYVLKWWWLMRATRTFENANDGHVDLGRDTIIVVGRTDGEDVPTRIQDESFEPVDSSTRQVNDTSIRNVLTDRPQSVVCRHSVSLSYDTGIGNDQRDLAHQRQRVVGPFRVHQHRAAKVDVIHYVTEAEALGICKVRVREFS